MQKDGTLQVNDPVPKPLRELQQRKGPGRPLPPTPDDDDTMRRAASGSQLATGIQRMDSSPGNKTCFSIITQPLNQESPGFKTF